MQDPIIVSICCLAYNHAPYIRQCLDGFMMQKTDFAFEVLIHDDASTDGTADIIREYETKYPDIIKPIYQTENQYSKGIGVTRVYQFPRAKGKYIAMCEGDDYWIDPLKLQKQVDFLEENPEYGLVHTSFNYVDVNSCKIDIPDAPIYKYLDKRIRNGYVWNYMLNTKGFILTCTVCVRKSLLRQSEEYSFDIGMFLMIARQSKIMHQQFYSACYRRNNSGIMLSSPSLVSKSLGLTLLFQLYYFYSKTNTYKKYYSFKARMDIYKCFANIVLRLDSQILHNYKIILFILKKDPFLLFALPITVPVILYGKKIKKK